jgi:hypothetical protein
MSGAMTGTYLYANALLYAVLAAMCTVYPNAPARRLRYLSPLRWR